MKAEAGSEAIVAAFYEAYNSGDVAAVVGLYVPEARHLEVAQGRIAEGREAIGAGLRHFLECFPDAHWEVLRRVVAGQEAAVSYRLTGTLQRQLGSYVPVGQALALQGVHIFALQAEGIAATEDYWDAGSFGRQMRTP